MKHACTQKLAQYTVLAISFYAVFIEYSIKLYIVYNMDAQYRSVSISLGAQILYETNTNEYNGTDISEHTSSDNKNSRTVLLMNDERKIAIR